MTYVAMLDSTIEGAVKQCTGSLDRFGVLFSGGLDSSLLAKMCIDLNKRPVLCSVFMKRSKDEAHVKKARGFFDLEFVEREISENEVEDYVRKVALIASTKNILDISIGVSIYAALEAASKSGVKSVMVGQGADELFGGYHRYLKMEGEALERELRKDVASINVERDQAIAKACNVTLLLPYLDKEVVELGLRIPVEWKIRDGMRKFVLREVAKKRGLPEEIWAREKKAIQYSTGVDKVVKRMIKKGF